MFVVIALGLAVGLISSFFGVGGGVVIVPGLASLFPNFPHSLVIACSLSTICVNGIINSFYFYKSGLRPNFKVVGILGLFMVLGSLLGAKLGVSLDQELLRKMFAGLLFVVFIKTVLPKKQSQETARLTKLELKSILLLGSFGLMGGILAGLTGVGGGIIIVPLLLSIFNVPYKEVSAYSNPVMTMATFAATVTYLFSPMNTFVPLPPPYDSFQYGHVNLLVVTILVLASAASAPLGVKLTGLVSPKKSKYAFASLVLFMAIKMSIF